MKLGYFGIGSGPCADPQVAARVAQAAEGLGYESLWTGEHVVLPDPQAPPSPAPPGFPMLHPSAALSFLAGVTETVKLGTGIVILPQRNPLVVAKELASVDVLSGGRLIFGLGAGYLGAEFAALGANFAERGAVTDEAIEVIRELWTSDAPEFAGKHFNFSGIRAEPRPVQDPHPPIVIGGHSPAAFRRAVKQGDGWYGFALDLDATAGALQGLADAATRHERPAGRPPLEISVTPRIPVDADSLKRFEDLGVERLIPLSGARTADDLIAFLEQTREAVESR